MSAKGEGSIRARIPERRAAERNAGGRAACGSAIRRDDHHSLADRSGPVGDQGIEGVGLQLDHRQPERRVGAIAQDEREVAPAVFGGGVFAEGDRQGPFHASRLHENLTAEQERRPQGRRRAQARHEEIHGFHEQALARRFDVGDGVHSTPVTATSQAAVAPAAPVQPKPAGAAFSSLCPAGRTAGRATSLRSLGPPGRREVQFTDEGDLVDLPDRRQSGRNRFNRSFHHEN